jgi:heme exporter protein CcmD
MPEWIHNPHAGFVLAAYAIASVALIGLALLSWREHAARQAEWKKLRHDS